MRRIGMGCCARAASGQSIEGAAAVPPRSDMNSRRFRTGLPFRRVLILLRQASTAIVPRRRPHWPRRRTSVREPIGRRAGTRAQGRARKIGGRCRSKSKRLSTRDFSRRIVLYLRHAYAERTLASTGLSEELPENGDVPEVSAVSPGAIGGHEFNFGN
jgi:hypothetical protein